MSFFKPIFAKNKEIKAFKDMGFRHSVRRCWNSVFFMSTEKRLIFKTRYYGLYVTGRLRQARS